MARTPSDSGTLYQAPAHRRRGIPVDRIPGRRLDRRAAVEGAAEAVEHLPEQVLANRHAMHAAGRADFGVGGNPEHLAERGEQRLVLLEADDLGEQRQALVGIAQLAEFADAHAGHHGLEQGSGDLGDPPADLDRLGSLRWRGASGR